MKIALFLPNWIGDTVMATPTLRALRQRFAQAEIVGIARPYVAEVLTGLDFLDRLILQQRSNKHWNFQTLAFIHKLRTEKFDLAVLFPNSFRSACYAFLAGAKQRVGFRRDGRGWLLTDRLTPQSKQIPHPLIDEYLRLAQHLNCTDSSYQMELAVTSENQQQLDNFWNKQSFSSTAKVICLNPGGAFGSAKHWPVNSFAKLAYQIASKLERRVLVLCGPQEKDQARKIVSLANHSHIFSLSEAPVSIGLTKAAIKNAELLVTTDSGPRHFASAFNIPVLTLFGPTHIAWSETYDPRALHLQLNLDCGPCQQRECPVKHHRCMQDLSVEYVFDQLVRHLVNTKPTVTSAA